MTDPLPNLSMSMSFDSASEAVLDYLQAALPLDHWSVSRYDGCRQVDLTVRGDVFGIRPGDSRPWSETLCQFPAAGMGPDVAPDTSQVPLYTDLLRRLGIEVGTYVGITIRRADGSPFGMLCGAHATLRPDGVAEVADLLRLLGRLLSVILQADLERTQTHRALERAHLESQIDPLTGLYNRRGWESVIASEEDRFRRFGDPVSVLALDIDGLKRINDIDGHSAGDAHIRRTADTLRRSLRVCDIPARLGGDEFGVIASPATPDQADAMLGRLREAFARAGLSVSAGSASFHPRLTLLEAWNAADEAMYADKRDRRALAPVADALEPAAG